MKLRHVLLSFILTIIFSMAIYIETSTSIFAAEHIHGDDCYNGDRHVHSGSSSSGGGCYGNRKTGSRTCGSTSAWFRQTYVYACSVCGTTITGTTGGSCWKGDGGSFEYSYTSGGWQCNGCNHGKASDSFPPCSNSISTTYYEINCGKDAGSYYNGSSKVSHTCHEVVTKISATNQSIIVGEDIKKTATATYLNGDTGTVNCTATGFNTNTIGNQTVTFTYTGKVGTAKSATNAKTTINITVTVQSGLEYISVILSSSTVYNGSEPTYTIRAYYGDGTNKTLTSSQYTKTGWSAGVGVKNVTISYTEGTKTVTKGITITVKPNVVYLHVVPSATTIYQRESVDFTVSVYYEDSTSKELLVGEYGQSSFDPDIIGVQTINFSYIENSRTVTTHINITVLAQLASISVEVDITEIYRGDESPIFTLTAFYESGFSKMISQGKYEAFNNNRIGNQTIPFSYTENGTTKTASITIKVKPNLSRITTDVKNDIIFVGHDLELTVTAVYEDDSDRILSEEEYNIIGFDNMVLGEQHIFVSYTENSVTANEDLIIIILEPGFDAYASPPIITPTSNSVGSKILFTARTYNAEIVDILYSVDNSGYFSSNNSELKLMEGAHTIRAKTVWRKLLEVDNQVTGYSSLQYDISVPGFVIKKPSINYDKLSNVVTITDNGAVNTIIDRIEYSVGKLVDGEYAYTDHIYLEPFTLSPLGDFIIKARVVDIDSNRSYEEELQILVQVEVNTPTIKYNRATKSFILDNHGCLNADFDSSCYKINNDEWKIYNPGENISLSDGEHIIKAYNQAVRDEIFYKSEEATANITVTSSPVPNPGSGGSDSSGNDEGGILNNASIISLIALLVFLFGWMITQKLK